MAARAKMQPPESTVASSETLSPTKPSAPSHLAGLMAARAKMQPSVSTVVPLSSPKSSTMSSKSNTLEGLMADRAKKIQIDSPTVPPPGKIDDKNTNSNRQIKEGKESQSDAKGVTTSSAVQRMRGCFWEPLLPLDEKKSFFATLSGKEKDSSEYASSGNLTLPSSIFESITKEFTQTIMKKELTEEERIGRSVGAIGGTLSKGSLTFMDQRRFNNIAIKLRQINKTNEFIRVAVLKLDSDFLTMDRVVALLQCAPTGDDMESIEPYDGDPELLATCERFFYDIQHVSFFTRRIEAFKAKLEVRNEIDELMKIIGNLTIALHSIFFSKSLPQFVDIVLQIGNFMNSGTSRGQASSFDISFLPKLSYIKTGNLKSNLMKFIVSYLKRERPELLDALDHDLAVSLDASKYSFKQIDALIARMKKKMNIIRTVTNSVRFKNKKGNVDPDDQFEVKMSEFIATIDLLLNPLITGIVDRLKKNVDIVLKYFGVRKGEDDDSFKPESFFSNLNEFSCHLNAAKNSVIQDTIVEKIKRLKKEAYDSALEVKRARAEKSRTLQASKKLHSSPSTSTKSNAKLKSSGGMKEISSNSENSSGSASQDAFASLINATKKSMGRKNRQCDRKTNDNDELYKHELKALDDTIVRLSPTIRPSNKKSLKVSSSSTKTPYENVVDLQIGSLYIPRQCVEVWRNLQSGKGTMNWFAMKLEYNTNALELCGSGVGGLSELHGFVTQSLQDSGIQLPENSYTNDTYKYSPTTKGKSCNSKSNKNVMYNGPLVACIRATGVDGGSHRHKFVAIYFNPGKNIPMKLRGQVGQSKSSIQSFLNGVHVELSTETFMDDIDSDMIIRRLLASGGAHSPHYSQV